MMDSVEKIRRDGKSTLLSSLADRVGNVVSSGSTPSCNIERDTVIGEPAKKVVTVSSLSELKSIGNSVEVIIVSWRGCNESDMRVLDLSRFANLRFFVVNDDSFVNVEEVKIGYHSFVDYTVCEIENNESLEVIEIGELNQDSINFKHDSELKLKSDCDGMI